jgi:restriction system protein
VNIPKYHETFIPILKSICDGNEYSRKDLTTKVENTFYSHLSDDKRNQKLQTGGKVITNRIGWGLSNLKAGKLIFQPKRATYIITEKGKIIAQRGTFTLHDLRIDTDYLEHEAKKLQSQQVDLSEDLTAQDMIENGYEIIKNETQNELLERLKNVDPYYFEKVILILLKKMGYGDFVETKKSGDGGIDGIINEDKLGLSKIYMQAKKFDGHNVREPDIRNFIGAMSGDTSKGVFATTASFDQKAIQKAKDAHHSIILIDGKKLVSLMHEYKVGLQLKSNYEIFELDEDFFEE